MRRLGRIFSHPTPPSEATGAGPGGERDLSTNLQRNLEVVRTDLQDPPDLTVREFVTAGDPPKKMAVVFLKTVADVSIVNECVIRPLMRILQTPDAKAPEECWSFQDLARTLPTARTVELICSTDRLMSSILTGKTVLFCDGEREALVIESTDTPSRSIQLPTSEVTVGGPQVGFTESVETNIALIRSRLRHPDLTIERVVLGRKSGTDVRVVYLRDIAPPEIVSELRRRLKAIDTDITFDPGMIRDLIGDRPYSPFIIERLTERPDTAAAEINLGRIAILVDGSPFVLIQPSQFFTLFETAEDYYMNALVATTLRLTRALAYLVSTVATPLYVAVICFHPELVPLPLLLNIAATQEGVPFPLPVAALASEIVLDIVREAGVRLPKQFGPAVSIVGALVLGQSAIQAGFVPPGLIIVVLFAAIASFAVPRSEQVIAYRLIRFPLLILASVLGFPGLAVGTLVIIYHLASLKTLGVPYFTLYTPGNVARLTAKITKVPAQAEPVDRPLGHRDVVRRGPAPELLDPEENKRRRTR